MDEFQHKRLFPKDFAEEYRVTHILEKSLENRNVEEFVGELPKKLVVQMEAIHVGRTKNFTFYTKDGLVSGLESWTKPYNKPVLTHHNDMHGEPIGRILSASFQELTASGKPGLVFTAEITDKQAIPKVLDGRYATVSIGASTDRVTCNICGTDRTQEFCEHIRGESYEDITCHYIVGTTMGREVSYVNVPADEYAGNVSVVIAESVENQPSNEPPLAFTESALGGSDMLEEMVDSVKEESNEVVSEETNDVQESIDASEEIVSETTESLPIEENQLTEQTATSEALTDKNQLLEEAHVLIEHRGREISALQKENESLLAQIKWLMAEKVVELKRQLHKPDVMAISKEQAIDEYAQKRSLDSLKDTLEDLQFEKNKPLREQLIIENPGLTTSEDKKTTMKEALDILNKMFKSKKGGF